MSSAPQAPARPDDSAIPAHSPPSPLNIEHMFDMLPNMTRMTSEETEEPVDPGSFAALVEELAAITDLVDCEPASLPEGQRKEKALVLAEALGRVEAAFADAVWALGQPGCAFLDGCRTVPSWVASRSELAQPHVAWIRKATLELEDLPVVADAWRTGVLGTPKIRMLLKVERHLRSFLVRDQEVLVPTLASKRVDACGRYLARWREGVLGELDRSPDDPKPAPEAPINSMKVRPGLDGEATLSGVFDSLTAAELTALTDAEIERLHREGLLDRADGKNLDQRRADALLALARRGADAPEADSSRSRVVVNVQVDLAWLFNLPARSTEELLKWPCETADGDPIPLAQVLENLDDATINLILGHLDRRVGRFRPVGEISTKRLADSSQRRMLRARDRSCRYPGCDSRASWAKAHHEPPWDLTHHTTVPELVLLCPYHHRLRHHENHRIELEPNGDITVRTPDGKLLTEPPPDGKFPPEHRPARFFYRRRVHGGPLRPDWEQWRVTIAA